MSFKCEWSLSDVIVALGVVASIASSHLLLFRDKKYERLKETYYSLYFEYFKIIFYSGKDKPLHEILKEQHSAIRTLLNKNFRCLDEDLVGTLNKLTFESPSSIDFEFIKGYEKLHKLMLLKSQMLEKKLKLPRLSEQIK